MLSPHPSTLARSYERVAETWSTACCRPVRVQPSLSQMLLWIRVMCRMESSPVCSETWTRGTKQVLREYPESPNVYKKKARMSFKMVYLIEGILFWGNYRQTQANWKNSKSKIPINSQFIYYIIIFYLFVFLFSLKYMGVCVCVCITLFLKKKKRFHVVQAGLKCTT